jgi:hypothetical protein
MFISVFFVQLYPCFFTYVVVVHTLYRVFLCTVLLSVLGMPMLYGLLSHQSVGKVCICYLSLCSISLLRNILLLLLLLCTILVHNFRSPSHIQASKDMPSFRRPNLCNGERALLSRTHFIIYLIIKL